MYYAGWSRREQGAEELLRASLSQWTSPSDERRRVQEVDNALSDRAEGASGSAANNRAISLRLTADERERVKAAAASKGVTLTVYVKARLFATPTHDRTSLAVVSSLHVAGLAMLRLLDSPEADADLRRSAEQLVAEMRATVEQIAKHLP